MNYLLEVISQPEFVVKFKKDNPKIDNDLDLGNFVKPELIKQPLGYIDANNGKITFDVLLTFDAITAVSGGILVSNRMRTLIEENFPHEVQFFETIIDFKGEKTTDFFVINIYNKIECYDLEDSIYEKNPVDNSYEFEKITPVKGPLEEYGIEYNIVRSVYDNKIVVSDKFKNLMTKNKINSLEYNEEFIMEW